MVTAVTFGGQRAGGSSGQPRRGLTWSVSLLSLSAKGKKIPEAGAQCLALTFLAKAAGSESVFDLILLPAK